MGFFGGGYFFRLFLLVAKFGRASLGLILGKAFPHVKAHQDEHK